METIYVTVRVHSNDGDKLGSFDCGRLYCKDESGTHPPHGSLKRDREVYSRDVMVAVREDMATSLVHDYCEFPLSLPFLHKTIPVPPFMSDDVLWMMVDAAKAFAFPEQYIAYIREEDKKEKAKRLPDQVDPYGYEASGR